jgi:hypothetical protein
MRARWSLLALVLGAAGCMPGAAPVRLPPREQPIRVTAEADRVTVAPNSVVSGTRYLLFEGPDVAFTLVADPKSDAATPAPLDPDAVNRVSSGNYAGTTLIPMRVTCAADRWTPERKWAGCGELFKIELQPGNYPILPADPQPDVPGAMFVLEVVNP